MWHLSAGPATLPRDARLLARGHTGPPPCEWFTNRALPVPLTCLGEGRCPRVHAGGDPDGTQVAGVHASVFVGL